MGARDVCGCGVKRDKAGRAHATRLSRQQCPALSMRVDAGGCGWGVHLTLQKKPHYFCPRSWRISPAGRGACVVSVRGLAPLPLGLCATLASAPSLSKNYDDTSISFGRLTLKIVTLISIALALRPHSCTLVRLWVCYF